MASEIRYLFLIAGKKPRAADGAVRRARRGAYPRLFLRLGVILKMPFISSPARPVLL